VPQPPDDVHAPSLDLGGLRILVLVDHVLIRRLGHQRSRRRRHPRRYERRQVQARAAVEQQLVRNQVVRDLGAGALLEQLVMTQILYPLLEHERAVARAVNFWSLRS